MSVAIAFLVSLASYGGVPKDPVFAAPQWLEAPVIDVQTYYPREAFKAHMPGRVVVAGDIAASGELRCRVVSEEPADAGFGQAGLEICRQFRLSPLKIDGVPVDGGQVEVPISFSVE